jgi:hypothetical protein
MGNTALKKLGLMLVLSFLTAAGSVSAAYINIDQIDLDATERCIGVSASYTGLPQSDTFAFVQYRTAGANEWLRGADLVQATKSPLTRYIGSVFCLTPGTAYDVRVVFRDSGGVVDSAQTSVTTADWRFPDNTGATYYVAVNGNDNWPGTEVFPWATLQYAVNQAGAGDTIIVQPGTYYQQCSITRSGTQGHPITIMGAFDPTDGQTGPEDMTVIDGSNPALLRSDNWTYVSSGGYYRMALSQEPHLVFVEYGGAPVRLYNHETWSQFLNGSFSTIYDGWYYSGGTLYVRLPSSFGDRNPAHYDMHINTYGGGVNDWNALTVYGDWVSIKNLKIRYAYYGIHPKGADHTHIARNDIRYFKRGINHRSGGSYNVYEYNYFGDTLDIFNWPWDAGKSGIQETCAIRQILETMTQVGTGNILRYNQTFGVTNGIYCNTLNTDVHGNLIEYAADDAFELDCPNLSGGSHYTENLRLFENRANQVYTGLSLSPGRGLIYFFHNAVTNFKRMGIKVATSNASPGPFRIFNNTFWSEYDLSCGNYAFRMDASLQNALVLNNIFCATLYAVYDVGYADTDSISFDSNCFWSWRTSTFFRWRNQPYDTLSEVRSAFQNMVGPGNIEDNPRLDNPAPGTPDLASDSPCVDTGCFVNGLQTEDDPSFGMGYAGSAPDMGCSEYESAIVIDDGDPAFRLVSYGGGVVRRIPHPGAYEGKLKFAPAGTGQTVGMWVIDDLLAVPGRYEVFIYKFQHAYLGLMATGARFTVCHSLGDTLCLVDLSACPETCQWESLGLYDFDGTGTQGVQISDEADGFVMADAVKFVYAGPLP